MSKDAIRFCTDFKVHQSVSFDIDSYTMKHAVTLARGWAHKMQHFLNLSARRDADGFTPGEFAYYQEPT